MDAALRACFPTEFARLRGKSTRDVSSVAASRYDDDLVKADSKVQNEESRQPNLRAGEDDRDHFFGRLIVQKNASHKARRLAIVNERLNERKAGRL